MTADRPTDVSRHALRLDTDLLQEESTPHHPETIEDGNVNIVTHTARGLILRRDLLPGDAGGVVAIAAMPVPAGAVALKGTGATEHSHNARAELTEIPKRCMSRTGSPDFPSGTKTCKISYTVS